mmetsp:Transcript_63274/g.77457  ORF Transcript_63274/g.77457 Transcript_63274/m.77457 type:complete len:279 (+) Transcript_63274:228-1064(+)
MCGNLECASPRHNRLIFHAVLHSSEAILDGILHLRNGMVCGALNKDRAALRVFHPFNEGELVILQGLFVDQVCMAQVINIKIIHGVDCNTTNCQRQALHITALCPPEGNDALMCQHFQGWWVNALLVDEDKRLFVFLCADLLFQFNDLLHLLVSELAFRIHQFFPLFCTAVEKACIDLALLILQRYVGSENIAVLQSLWHVWMSCSVVKHKTLDQTGVCDQLVLHVQNLHHVEVKRLITLLNCTHSINDNFCHWICQIWCNLRPQGSSSHAHQLFALF